MRRPNCGVENPEKAKGGHGQIVAVMGEPGVGKSRLFHEFKLLLQQGCLFLETFSVSHSKAYPYLPLIELLKNYFQITLQDDERRRREKINSPRASQSCDEGILALQCRIQLPKLSIATSNRPCDRDLTVPLEQEEDCSLLSVRQPLLRQ